MRVKEVKVPNLSQVYRLVELSGDGDEKKTNRFRVRKRIKVNGKWTTRPQTFESFEEAKIYSKQAFKPQELRVSRINHSFKDVLKRFLHHKEFEMKLSRGTIDGLKNRSFHLKFFEKMEMSEISPRVLDAWVNLLINPDYLAHQKKSRINYRHEFSLLSTLFKFYRNYEDENFINPILDRHRERLCAKRRSDKANQIRFLNSVQEDQFLVAFQDNFTYQDLALFQLQTGTRIGEAAALEFKNIDFVRNEVTICQHIDWPRKRGDELLLGRGTKGGPIRVIPLTERCKTMLKRRLVNARNEIVFADKENQWLMYRDIQVFYDRAFDKAKLTHRGSHTLRHTFAVRFLEETKDIYALQRTLGHASLEETQTYAKYTNESVRKAFQLFRGGKTIESDPHVPQLVPRNG